MALTVLCKIFDVIHSADYHAGRRLLRIMTDFSKNIGGFFVLFQALSVTIRLNATLASVAICGIPASSRAVVVVDLTQACRERYFLHHVTQFIHCNWWIFKPYFVAREKIAVWLGFRTLRNFLKYFTGQFDIPVLNIFGSLSSALSPGRLGGFSFFHW